MLETKCVVETQTSMLVTVLEISVIKIEILLAISQNCHHFKSTTSLSSYDAASLMHDVSNLGCNSIEIVANIFVDDIKN